MDGIMNTCGNCTHYHDLGDKLMCDKGIMECLIISGQKVNIQMVQVDGCSEFDQANTTEVAMNRAILDKRSKAYRDAHK